MAKHFWQAIATLTSMIIGAGLFALPSVISQAGFLLGTLQIVGIGTLMVISSLYLGEILLRTKKDHQMYGLARKYLGKKGGYAMLIAFGLGAIGALSAYIIGEAESWNILFGINKFTAGAIYWGIFSVLLIFGLKIFEKIELFINVIKVTFFILIFVVAMKIPSYSHELNDIRMYNFFLPITTIVFAFLGFSALPEVKEELKGNLRKLKKVIISSYIIAAIVYLLFCFIIILKTGGLQNFEPIALLNYYGLFFVVFVKLFEIVTLATATLALGFAFKETMIEDMNLNKYISWSITIILPVFIALLFRDFGLLISIVGAITGGTLGILTVLMHRKAVKHSERKPEYSMKSNIIIDTVLIILFVSAILAELIVLLF